MPVPIDNIAVQVKIIKEIFDLAGNQKRVDPLLWGVSNNLGELLEQDIPSSTKHVNSIVKLLKIFKEKDIIIPLKFKKASSKVILLCKDSIDSLEFKEAIDSLNVLGVHEEL